MRTVGARMLWAFESPDCVAAGALPPERLRTPDVDLHDDSAYRLRDFGERWRAIEAGKDVEASDCPSIRMISGYGFIVRCPGEVGLRRINPENMERTFRPGYARFGRAEITGSPWPGSDSGLVASWISGSEYVKIHTGVRILFDIEWWLYQGPPPNADLSSSPIAGLMAGIEHAHPSRTVDVGGTRFGVAQINSIIRLPPATEELRISRGDCLAWLFPVPKGPLLQEARVVQGEF